MKKARRAAQSASGNRLILPPGGGAGKTPYPRFDVASPDKWRLDWDEKTRKLVIERVTNIPPYRFFSPEEAALLEAVCACLLPQSDRPPAARAPVAPWIDARLFAGEGPGYRYESMPADGQAYRLGLQGFDQAARLLFGAGFAALALEQQKDVVAAVAGGNPPGEAWERLPAVLFFQKLMGDVITHYYAHPAAWAEIGFHGPASPRGHIRLGLDQRDPWEAQEEAPHSSVEIVRSARARAQGPAKGGPTH
jgi:hypothetical protein